MFYVCVTLSQDGQLKVEREKVTIETPELDPSLIFEQDPVQILDALLPLYMNSCLLRSLQEALASELAARMNAMNSATDNAKELKKVGQAAVQHCGSFWVWGVHLHCRTCGPLIVDSLLDMFMGAAMCGVLSTTGGGSERAGRTMAPIPIYYYQGLYAAAAGPLLCRTVV